MTAPQGTLSAESDLVTRAQDGDSGAWDELARRHRKPAYLLALQLTGNPDDALDLSQPRGVSFDKDSGGGLVDLWRLERPDRADGGDNDDGWADDPNAAAQCAEKPAEGRLLPELCIFQFVRRPFVLRVVRHRLPRFSASRLVGAPVLW